MPNFTRDSIVLIRQPYLIRKCYAISDNGTINNSVIMKFGNVNIKDVLSDKQIMNLLHKPFISVEECVKMIHFNDKLPQFNNIRASARYITNLKDDLVYVYDGSRFTTTTKTDTIYDMITNYTEQIELSFDDNKVGKAATN